MKTVLVLGCSGMLGSMLVDYLSQREAIHVTGAIRASSLLDRFQILYPRVRWIPFAYDAEAGARNLEKLGQHDWIINAIGITKPLIKDDNPMQVENAVLVNCILPHDLGRYAERSGARVVQIATDCVYSGTTGCYKEDALHDATDVYGKSKSLGESWQPGIHHLRCSIIGPEPKDFKFLIEWFRRQPQGASVNGFTNHSWNGLTTLHFAKVCCGIITNDVQLGHLQHVIPNGAITKAAMLHAFARAYQRGDVVIHDVEAKTIVDRTLGTNNPVLNASLWRAAGYTAIPNVSEMIAELGSYSYKGAGPA